MVLDNLSAHKPVTLYEVFAPELARNVLRRLEFHFVPKHASWLNMVEIEIGVLGKQCLDRRIPDRETLQREIAHWERRRNAEGARVEWLFDVQGGRTRFRLRGRPSVPRGAVRSPGPLPCGAGLSRRMAYRRLLRAR